MPDIAPCRLRPYTAADAEALHAAVRESMTELLLWMPWAHEEYTLEEARTWLASRQEAAQRGQEYDFAILDFAGQYVGGCGINHINRVHGFANLGYWVRTNATGRGTATTAAGLLRDWAFANTDLIRLEIVCASGNRRSQGVAERAGAFREGILRSRLLIHGRPHDAVMYSFTREPLPGGRTSPPGER